MKSFSFKPKRITTSSELKDIDAEVQEIMKLISGTDMAQYRQDNFNVDNPKVTKLIKELNKAAEEAKKQYSQKRLRRFYKVSDELMANVLTTRVAKEFEKSQKDLMNADIDRTVKETRESIEWCQLDQLDNQLQVKADNLMAKFERAAENFKVNPNQYNLNKFDNIGAKITEEILDVANKAWENKNDNPAEALFDSKLKSHYEWDEDMKLIRNIWNEKLDSLGLKRDSSNINVRQLGNDNKRQYQILIKGVKGDVGHVKENLQTLNDYKWTEANNQIGYNYILKNLNSIEDQLDKLLKKKNPNANDFLDFIDASKEYENERKRFDIVVKIEKQKINKQNQKNAKTNSLQTKAAAKPLPLIPKAVASDAVTTKPKPLPIPPKIKPRPQAKHNKSIAELQAEELQRAIQQKAPKIPLRPQPRRTAVTNAASFYGKSSSNPKMTDDKDSGDAEGRKSSSDKK